MVWANTGGTRSTMAAHTVHPRALSDEAGTNRNREEPTMRSSLMRVLRFDSVMAGLQGQAGDVHVASCRSANERCYTPGRGSGSVILERGKSVSKADSDRRRTPSDSRLAAAARATGRTAGKRRVLPDRPQHLVDLLLDR